MMKKAIVGAAVCAASVLVGGTGSVLAGEIRGNGERNVPIHDHPGNSICAYSGQNDEYHEVSTDEPRVQSWGQIVQEYVKEVGSPGSLAGVPGDECRGGSD